MNKAIKTIYEVVLSGYKIENAGPTYGMWKDHIKLRAWRDVPDNSKYAYLEYIFYLHHESDKCTFLFSK